MEHLSLEVRLVDDVVVHDPEPSDARGRQVESRRGAEPAGADEEDARLQHPLLPRLADLRDQQVPAVAAPLIVVQPGRHLDGQPGPLPGHDPSRKRYGVVVSGLGQGIGNTQRPVSVGAVDDQRTFAVLLQLAAELAHRDPERPVDPPGLPFPALADVHEERAIVLAKQLVRPGGVDLPENLAVTRHAPRIIVAG